MTIVREVDELIDHRGGKELLTPHYDDKAVAVNDFVYTSGGHTNAYLIVTTAGRIVVNTGLGFEAVHHRALFDRVCPGPTPYVVTTQGHTDHVGGVAVFREPETVYVAHRDNPAVQHQDARIRGRMRLWSTAWFDLNPSQLIERFAAERPDLPMGQDHPVPDLTFDERMAFSVGNVELELWHGTGETTDGAIVWLPRHRIALISNLLGPLFCHFPNLNTLRGHSYRFVEPYLATIRRIRELRPATLLTGRGAPIVGTKLIDACLARTHDAVDFVHRETLRGINEGADLPTLVRDVQLPAELRVGEGYGKVSWGVRTIWESYLGWFRHDRTSTLLPVDPAAIHVELVRLAGTDNVVARATELLRQDRPSEALALAEAVVELSSRNRAALQLLCDIHRRLLDDTTITANFWLSGWIEYRIGQLATGGET